MSSDKENMPPTESVTPPSLRNLSLEEEANKPKNKATSWEASVARNIEMIPRASSPYPRKTSTLEDLEPDTDKDIIDVTDYSEMIKGLLDLNKQTQHKDTAPHLKTAPHIWP